MSLNAPSDDWLACRAEAGVVVPSGCCALSHVGSTVVRHGPGEKTESRKEGRLWWVRQECLTFSFAPDPGAPEAGLRMDISPVIRDGEWWFVDELADWLKLKNLDVLDSAHLAEDIRRRMPLPLEKAMLPCISTKELNDARQMLNSAMPAAMGVTCSALFRTDLAAEAEAKFRVVAVVAESAASSADYQHELERNEAYCESRFRRELRALSVALNKRELPALGSELFSRVDELRYRYLHLKSSRSGLRPQPLESQVSREQLSKITRLRAIASRQATAGLNAAWAALAIGQPQVSLTLEQVVQLESALDQMQSQLDQVYAPWWELAL
jgi:hypothetical protein